MHAFKLVFQEKQKHANHHKPHGDWARRMSRHVLAFCIALVAFGPNAKALVGICAKHPFYFDLHLSHLILTHKPLCRGLVAKCGWLLLAPTSSDTSCERRYQAVTTETDSPSETRGVLQSTTSCAIRRSRQLSIECLIRRVYGRTPTHRHTHAFAPPVWLW